MASGFNFLYRSSLCLVAIVFVVAGILKFQSDKSVLASNITWISNPYAFYSLATAEICLAMWLLSGLAKSFSWLVSLIAAVVFLVASAAIAILGYPDCGCFGNLHIHPWVVSLIDFSMVCVLLFVRPPFAMLKSTRELYEMKIVATAAIMVAMSAAFITLGLYLSGIESISHARAMLRGEPIFIPSAISIGPIQRGQSAQIDVIVSNHSDMSVRLFGAVDDCICSFTDQLPIDIPPQSKITLSGTFKAPDTIGRFEKKVYFIYGATSRISTTIICKVIE